MKPEMLTQQTIDTNLKLSRYHAVTPRLVDEAEQRPKRVVFATRTAEVRLIDEAGWQAIESGAFESLPSEVLSDLLNIELLVPADENELKTVLSRHKVATKDDDVLSLVIQPTAHCQLGCGYCGQQHSRRWLNHKHQDDFIERARAKLALRKFRHLEIGWFGAEPLSGISVMRSLTPRLKALAKSFDCTYRSTITTNGLALTDKIATELVSEHSVREITITLDGVAEFHDTRRHRKSGQATFNQIFSNVVALARRDLGVQINIRTNVDRGNWQGVSPLIGMLAEAGVQDRVTYYVAPVHSWGNDAHTRSLSPQEFADQEIEWFWEMMKLGFPERLIPSLRPIVCIAVQPHTELIDAMGTLFNCTEVSYVPTYGTPNKFAIGHVSTGEIWGKRDLLGDFNSRLDRGEYPCSSCRMLPVCGGACPKAWMEGHEPCPSAKRNIEDRLSLFYVASRLREQNSVQDTTTQNSPTIEPVLEGNE